MKPRAWMTTTTPATYPIPEYLDMDIFGAAGPSIQPLVPPEALRLFWHARKRGGAFPLIMVAFFLAVAAEGDSGNSNAPGVVL